MATPELNFVVKPIENTFPVVKTLALNSSSVRTQVNADGEFRVDLVLSHSLFSKDEGEATETIGKVLDDEGSLRGIVWNGSNCMILNEVKDFEDVSYGRNVTSQKCKSGKRKYIVPTIERVGLKQNFRVSLVFDVDLLKMASASSRLNGSTYNVNSSFYLVTKDQLLLVPNLSFVVQVVGERGELSKDFANLEQVKDNLGMSEDIPKSEVSDAAWWRQFLTKICGM